MATKLSALFFLSTLCGCFAEPYMRPIDITFDTNSLEDNSIFVQADEGFSPPSPGSNASLSGVQDGCPCKQILISSLGEAQHIQPGCMGVYQAYTQFNSHPAYQGPGGRRLFFLVGSGWLIAPTIGAPQGYIHNSNAYLCPYMINAGWMFVNNGYWYVDNSLVVRCIQ